MIGVRVNNIELNDPYMQDGWLLFNVNPKYLAVGKNLVGVHLLKSISNKDVELDIEKLEIHVVYNFV